ncbi:SIS domain-containing protein [Roseateles sp. SL47]|jgi:D-sedoheptulose 7-phosphate isomerase|uniref:SIS domain-containing protein n=1 Tax=Roseateles sp. SL47 TaxID=2995138 RepID=UPI00226D5B4A|nr:SIS domain-containing protein [Roseateles sp. SL47]WAC73311.1 SIS domain-containing protein [Roseateles sp. SL47]
MLEQRIQQQFFESADLLYQVAENLSRPLAVAAQMMVDALTAGGRVWCAGLGLSAADASYAASLLAGRFEQERPGLAVIALDAQAQGYPDPASALMRQIQTLGHPGDLLLLFESQGSGAAGALLQVAHAQDMSVIALSGTQDDDWRSTLLDTDVQLRVPHSRFARVGEAHRLLSHCLADAIDVQLLGAAE